MPSEFRRKHAILIGVDQYDHVSSLKFCRADAESLAKALSSLAFDPVLSFIEGSQTCPPVRARLFHFLGRINETGEVHPDDLLLFFFSGHGMIGKEDGKDYLLLQDATLYNLKETAIRVEDIAAELKRTGCKNIVMFIDACRELPGARGLVSIGESSAESLRRAGIVTFFSCDPKDKSWEIEELKHGSFTYCILDAIDRGEGNTVAALESFLRRQVPVVNAQYNAPPQLPYAIIAPAEKNDMPVFFTHAQQQQVDECVEEWLRMFADFCLEGEIAEDLFNKVVEFLDGPRDGAFEQDKRTEWIRQLHKRAIKPTAFRVLWEAQERRKIAGTQTSLGRRN